MARDVLIVGFVGCVRYGSAMGKRDGDDVRESGEGETGRLYSVNETNKKERCVTWYYRVRAENIGTDCLPFFASLNGQRPMPLVTRPRSNARHKTHSSKCFPRFGSAFLFASTFRTLLSGRTTIIGTGEWLRQYLNPRQHH